MKAAVRSVPRSRAGRSSTAERLLSRVAHLYYVENLTQDDIAPLVNLSRSRVSRLLKEARERGYVSIHIRHPSDQHTDLERAAEHALGLKEVVVVQAPPSDVKVRLGVVAAEYLDRVFRVRLTLGIAWGSTVGEVVNALRPRVVPGLRVVQMTGSIYEPPISAVELTGHVAAVLGGRAFLLHAPAVVDSSEVRRAILSDSKIRRVFELHPEIDVALFGIGALQPAVSSSLMGSGFLSETDIKTLRNAGVVADVCSSFLLPRGGIYHGGIANRVIAIPPQDLVRIPLKIAVAGGAQKALAIAAACRARMVDVLITDYRAARGLVALATLPSAAKKEG